MINRETGDVTLEAGGRSYTLRLDLNAMCLLEGYFSTATKEVSFVEIVAKVNRGRMTEARAFFWAALRHHHPEVTIERVSEIVVALGGLPAINRQLSALAESAHADPADLAELEVPGPRPTRAAARTRAPRASTGAGSISKHAASG